MSSKAQIVFDFQNAMRQAEKLDDIAERLDRQNVNKISATTQDLAGAWKGESANLYLRKVDNTKNKVHNTANDIRSIASDIRYIARTVYNAEMEALRIAQQRNG